jgi:hypothetical protein
VLEPHVPGHYRFSSSAIYVLCDERQYKCAIISQYFAYPREYESQYADRLSVPNSGRGSDSAFGIVTRLWAAGAAKYFSLPQPVQTDSGTHPASYSMVTEGSAPGGKAAETWAVHSPPSSADVKNEWIYTSAPHGVDRDSSTCYLGGGTVCQCRDWATGWTTGAEAKDFFSKTSRPTVGLTWIPIQWVTGVLSWGYSGRGVKLTTHLHLVPRLRMVGAIPVLFVYVFLAWTGTRFHLPGYI